MGFLRRIIEMSDDISFFNIKGFDMVMSLDFYTKAVFKRDWLIHPQWSDLESLKGARVLFLDVRSKNLKFL